MLITEVLHNDSTMLMLAAEFLTAELLVVFRANTTRRVYKISTYCFVYVKQK